MVRSVTPRGIGFPDYTDIIHRVAISAYGKNQHYSYLLVKFTEIYGQTEYSVDIPPVPEGKKFYLYQVEVTTSVDYLVDLVVRIISDVTEEHLVSDYGGATFRPRIPIHLTSKDSLTIFFRHYGPATTAAYTSLSLWGVTEL